MLCCDRCLLTVNLFGSDTTAIVCHAKSCLNRDSCRLPFGVGLLLFSAHHCCCCCGVLILIPLGPPLLLLLWGPDTYSNPFAQPLLRLCWLEAIAVDSRSLWAVGVGLFRHTCLARHSCDRCAFLVDALCRYFSVPALLSSQQITCLLSGSVVFGIDAFCCRFPSTDHLFTLRLCCL
jgi:hypothetical protein